VVANVFRRLHRLEKFREHEAARAVGEAALAQAEQAAVVRDVERALVEARDMVEQNPVLFSYHHDWASHAEQRRRDALVSYEERLAETDRARDALLESARAALTVEQLAEVVELEVAIGHQRIESRHMDEMGVEQWRRRAS
jgi:hypothetical protein